MLLIYIAIYVIILFIVWWFYAVARMHIVKYKNFSTHLIPVTNFLMIFLIILSIIGFILVYMLWSSSWEIWSVFESDQQSLDPIQEEFREELTGEEYY